MWRRLFTELSVEFYWFRREIIRRWRLDTPAGKMGLTAVFSGIFLLFFIGQGIAHAFQTMIPWVSGSQVGKVYWSSIGLSIKFSLAFMIFCVSLILFILFKIFNYR